MLDLKAALQKAQEEARLAKEAAQLAKEASEAEKRAAYQLGVEETEARLSEELLEVCRDYYGISWAQALNAVGIPADSTLRLPERVFFPPEIREIPTDTTEAFEQPTVVPDAIPLAEIAEGSGQVTVRVEDAEEEKGKGKGKGKKPFSKAKDVPPPQPEQKEDPPAEA